MQILFYNRLNPEKIPNFDKMKAYLEAGDFRSAEVKKVGDNLYRCRLNKSNRLLFSMYRHKTDNYILLLEYIANHNYDKSRFLRRGATIDESKIPSLDRPEEEPESLVYLNPKLPSFNLLNKIISFDDAQHAVYHLPPPLIVIGSAGSGKTALTLEKMKDAVGEVLYVTRSPYLVRNSREIYYALGYENEDQEVSFLSFSEYLASLRVPEGREITASEFTNWVSRRRTSSKSLDAHQLLEEFKGVLTGPSTESAYLSLEDYLDLGIKQSIFSVDEREAAYDLFLKYLDFMKENGFYDANILSHQYLPLVQPRYDFIVVDEVQDLTNIQLQLVLKSLQRPQNFILCGDSNQIVHPNFFSWSKLKSFFYAHDDLDTPAELIRILNSNYRNSTEVTEIANRILKLKSARFGSIDRESNYLVSSSADKSGRVLLLENNHTIPKELNQKTRLSTQFAVVVMHPNQKTEAKRHFQTPLVFSIQEAKGLEYDNIILYNFTSPDEARFREISKGVATADIAGPELTYSRAKDKSDKSLEIYKFYINALYVAITRAIDNLYIVEDSPTQGLFRLLGLEVWEGPLNLEEQGSSLASWRHEAHKLDLQGKQEQAEEIRKTILKLQDVTWDVLKGEALSKLEADALERGNKKAKLLLFEYALVYQDRKRMNALAEVGFRPATQPEKGIKPLNRKYFFPYDVQKLDAVQREIDRYGVDFRNPFNQTPLMIAARLGKEQHLNYLLEMGADTDLVNNVGLNAFQIALEQTSIDSDYASKKLTGVYERLEPHAINIQVDGRLVKLDRHLMEFLMFNLMVAMFYSRLGDNAAWGNAFRSADFVEVLSHFPDEILPARRKKRAYISSILAKNEVNRVDKYNRKLFRRLKHGHYIINPKLSVWVEGGWRNIYDLLSLDALGFRGHQQDEFFAINWNSYSEIQLRNFKELVRALIDEDLGAANSLGG